MTTATVKNNHTGPLAVGGVTIQPKSSAVVQNWQKHQHNRTLQAWADAGIIEIKEERPSLPLMPGMSAAPKTVQTEDERRQEIISELQEKHGITKTMRSSLESLEKALAEANGA